MTKSNVDTSFVENSATFNMIEQQIRTWDVLDPVVLDLFNAIPRERFVTEAQQGLAFADVELPIGNGQTMLSPKVEGRILQAVQIKKTDKVLVVGTGSGYLTAMAATLADHVHAVEMHAELSATAEQRIKAQGINNVVFDVADGVEGFAAHAPYDVIIYTGSLEMRSKAAEAMLNVGGRLFAVIGEAPIMEATLTQRVNETAFKHDVVFDTYLPPMVNAPQLDNFEF
jgi:protein-L-isoaspartate(D-aspartate) O-methyltransferase